MGIDSLNNGIFGSIHGVIKENPLASTVGAVGAGLVAGVGASAIVGAIKSRKNKRSTSRNSRKRGSRIKHTKRGWKQDRARRSKQKWEVAYRRRKNKKVRKSRGRVRYARKTGQPYILLANGKAKFIKGKRRKS